MNSRLAIVSLSVFTVCCEGTSFCTYDCWRYKGPNIAFNKNAAQLPGTYQEPAPSYFSYQAKLAVDGNENNDPSLRSCSSTNGSSGENQHVAQWAVDLGGQFNISGIIIINRKDYTERLKNFAVFGWNNKTCSDYADWCFIYSDTKHSAYEKPKIYIPVNGQNLFSSVAVNLPRRTDGKETYLTLCEVKIYAAQPACRIIEPLSNRIVEIYNDSGSTVNGFYTAGTVLKVSCSEGYQRIGPSIVKCLYSGHFNLTTPLCTLACTNKTIDNGHMDPNKAVYTVQELTTIICNEGFKPSSQSITCQNTGHWTQYKQCKQVQCNYPGLPENAYYVTGKNANAGIYDSGSLPFGSSITTRCNVGYESKNSENRTCQKDETWSGREPVCMETYCPYPKQISNGLFLRNESNYVAGSSPYNSVIKVKCNKGYELIGNDELKCDGNKTWGKQPFCRIMTCKFPGKPMNGWYARQIKNGSYIPYLGGNSNYSDIIHIICPKGNVLISKSKVRECLEQGMWSGEDGQCVLVTCEGPEDLHGGFYNYTKPSTPDGFPYNTILTANCNDMFKLSNPEKRTRRCTEGGAWDEEPAKCISVGKPSGSNAALIGGSSAAGVLILSIASAIIAIVYRRRQGGKHPEAETTKRYADLKKKVSDKDTPPMKTHDHYAAIQDTTVAAGNDCQTVASDGVYSVAFIEESVKPSVAGSSTLNASEAYYNFTDINKIPKTAIPVKDLSDLVLTGKEARRKFEKQFESLPQGMTEPHSEALKLQNRGKNRYRNLYAYDDTRVVLETENESRSDYINACYVDGFKKTRQYIASQGPTKEILVDFWRMIWQTGCSKIVMLTNLEEEGKTKCEQYWPEQGTSMYGRIVVSVKKFENFSQFVIRTFTIRKEDFKPILKTVTQFHFTAWPDKGVPKHASSLVQFLNKVKYSDDQSKGPVIVHCSAGVGRTGTFIALDYLTEQGKTMGYVDAVGSLTTLRKQRVSLVQTLEQYIFVHHALVESLMLSTSALPASKFPEAFQELLQMDTEKKKRKICVEFETLKKVSPVTEECQYVSSKLVRNRQKNRYSNVLPVEECMPSLTSDDGEGDCYINAVFLPSYKNPKAFIVTQTPLDSTRQDFWRLVWEHDIHTIVMMNSIGETMKCINEQENERYWPEEGETVHFDNIEVTYNGKQEDRGHQVISLTVRKYKVTRKVKQIRCGKWTPDQSLPESPNVVLTLIEIVQHWQQQTENHTVLVHCMNGADKSGLYCVISAVIERMKIEQDVAISHVIEEMRNAREQIAPSVEQFTFCHEAILAFLHQYDTYSNFTA